MVDAFIFRSLAAGIGFALVSGPLGCFVLWRRLAFFGDTLAHASLCGVALSLLIDLDPLYGAFLVCFLIAIGLSWFKTHQSLSEDTLLAIISHGSLALGILSVSFIKGPRFDLNTYLFGDILSLSSTEVGLIFFGGIGILGGLMLIWRPLLSMTLAEDLAAIEGVPTRGINLIYMFLLGILVSFSLKMIGALLITALLILPASTAQSFAKSPEQMAFFSILIGIGMVLGGFGFSYVYDLPTSPAIVTVGMLLLLSVRLRKSSQ